VWWASPALAGTAPRRPSQSLLIHTRDQDPEAQAALEEDLNVMSRILEKIAASESDHSPRSMGIDLLFAVPTSPVRSLYLDGYGALFLVNVGYPLLPPPTTDQQANEGPRPEPETIWEQARQELYGIPQPPSPPAAPRVFGLGWTGGETAGPDYDPARVDALRQALLATIKHAANIRQLQAGESVTICVLGSPGAARVRTLRHETSTVAPGGSVRSGASEASIRREERALQRPGDTPDPGRGIMTIRAAKADIDRFAAGGITNQEFRELVKVQVYASGGWHEVNPFVRY
jgi:hypothetical protein